MASKVEFKGPFVVAREIRTGEVVLVPALYDGATKFLRPMLPEEWAAYGTTPADQPVQSNG